MGTAITTICCTQVATTALSKDQNVSSSLIYPVVNGLVKCHLKIGTDDHQMIIRFKETVKGELLSRFAFIPDSVPAISEALDPRYHHLGFFSSEEQSQVRDIISIKVDALHLANSENESTQPKAKKRKEDSAMSFLLGTECANDSNQAWRDKLKLFQIEPQIHHDSDSFEWWKANESRFPTIAKIARRYLCVTATSVPSERVFSAAGLVINNKRCSLTPENADMLIFLSKNVIIHNFVVNKGY